MAATEAIRRVNEVRQMTTRMRFYWSAYFLGRKWMEMDENGSGGAPHTHK